MSSGHNICQWSNPKPPKKSYHLPKKCQKMAWIASPRRPSCGSDPFFWPRCEPRVFRVLAVQRFKDLVVRILLSNITWRRGGSPSGLRSISSRWWMAKWLMIDWAKTTLATWVWIWRSPPESNLVSWHQSSQILTLTQHVATNKSYKKIRKTSPDPKKVTADHLQGYSPWECRASHLHCRQWRSPHSRHICTSQRR